MNKTTAESVLRKIIKSISKPPKRSDMLDDLKLMGFVITPTDGDIALFNTVYTQLILTLWKLGKIEDIIKQSKNKLTHDQLLILITHIENLQINKQGDTFLSSLQMQKEDKDKLFNIQFEIKRKILDHIKN